MSSENLKWSSSSIHIRTPSFVSPSKVIVTSVPAVPAPKVIVLPKSFVIGPPSPVVPSCVCQMMN